MKIADVSHHQGVIDWEKASKDLSLVIIRTKYGSNTTDRQYKNNIAGAEKYGVPYGLYHYAQFVNEKDAIQEARDFLKTATKQTRFLVLDVEEQTCKSVAELVKATQAFIDTCKDAGYRIGLYTGHHFYKSYGMDKVKADFLWIPRYGQKPIYNCDLWQHTDGGKVSGIKGNVDLNTINGMRTLAWFTGKIIKEAAVERPSVSKNKFYRLVTGTFGTEKQQAEALAKVKKVLGWTVYPFNDHGDLRLKTGVFSSETSAKKAVEQIKEKLGYIAYIKAE
ncbi:GH25 family lysozyme [Bacillus testis]|uniref:GH25 family lysozyme n=1 Tax=Bacillus testis TaxID=1622072 RepID=UPI00067EB81C|nr:GH25 family lysozyme [Bacillus testis]